MEVTKKIEEESEEQQGVYQSPLSSPVPGSFNKCMDNLNSLLSWVNYYQGKSMEELRHLLLCTTLELETTRLEALEEIRRREDQLKHLQHLLGVAIRERDEAQDKFQSLLMEKLQQQQEEEEIGPLSGNSSINDEYGRVDSSTGISSDGEESIVSPPPPPPPTPTVKLVAGKPLPEKGKLLEAVMKAGPLLQTLLLTGPLPQWQHQPPPLDSFEIPLVAVHSASGPPHFHHDNGGVAVSCEGYDPSTNTKYQRITLQ